jgi:hypothetical protein
MYKTLFTESIVKGVGKTIGSLVIVGALALTWYAGSELYEYQCKAHVHKKTQTNNTQTVDSSIDDENKYKDILSNLVF